MMRKSSIAVLVVLLSAVGLQALWGDQPGQSGNSTAPVQPPTRDAFPRVRLTYYVTFESGGGKEICYADLTEWTIEKDVYLEYVRNEEAARSFAPAPDTDARLAPDFAVSRPPSHIWRVRYEPAAKEGQSRLFVVGLGGRMGRARIYGDEDLILFLNIIGSGWRELGAEARVARYLANRVPASNPQLPTRSQ